MHCYTCGNAIPENSNEEWANQMGGNWSKINQPDNYGTCAECAGKPKSPPSKSNYDPFSWDEFAIDLFSFAWWVAISIMLFQWFTRNC